MTAKSVFGVVAGNGMPAPRRELAAMWCSGCRQEVPGVTCPVDGMHACPRCGILLGLDAVLDLADFTPELLAEAERVAPIAPREPLPDFKPVKPPQSEPVRISSLRWEAANWELNEKLRHVERVTATARRRYDEPSPPASVGPHFALPYVPTQPACRAAWKLQPHALMPPTVHSGFQRRCGGGFL